MPFGLTNTPTTFQFLIQNTLCNILDIFCIVYLDSILVFSHPPYSICLYNRISYGNIGSSAIVMVKTLACAIDFAILYLFNPWNSLNMKGLQMKKVKPFCFNAGQDHTYMVKQVFEWLCKAQLFANAKKCKFSKTSGKYLSFIIPSKDIQMNPKKFNTILEWPILKTIKQIQSFLGFTNFYRCFIHHYANLAIPLNPLTTKKAKEAFNGLTEAAEQAFDQLKLAFTTAPVLRHFDPLLPSTLITDASDYAFASILLQLDTEQLLHPISYYS